MTLQVKLDDGREVEIPAELWCALVDDDLLFPDEDVRYCKKSGCEAEWPLAPLIRLDTLYEARGLRAFVAHLHDCGHFLAERVECMVDGYLQSKGTKDGG